MELLRKSVPYHYVFPIIGVMVALVLLVSIIAIRNNQTGVGETADEPVTNQTEPKESTGSSEPKKTTEAPKTKESDTSNTESTKPPAKKTPPPQSSPPPSNKTVTVSIIVSGFSPATVTINSGDSVKWENDDSQSHWPASNVHSQHDDYPGFDSFGITAGGDWTFKFDNKGTWGYHDHQFTSRIGTIIVN